MAMNEMAMQMSKTSSRSMSSELSSFYNVLLIEILSVAESKILNCTPLIDELLSYLQTFYFQAFVTLNKNRPPNQIVSSLPSQNNFLASGSNKQEEKIRFFQIYQLIALRKILITMMGREIYEQAILKGQSYNFLYDSFWTKMFLFFNKKSSLPKQPIPASLDLQYLKD